MTDRTLEIIGQDISKINIYTITGQLIKSETKSFIFPFREAGYYLVSVMYNDNSVYNRKVIIK